jgi:hypothetical protein
MIATCQPIPPMHAYDFLAVFVDGVVGGKVTGYITTYPW